METDHAERQELLRLCAQVACTAVGVWEGAAALEYLQRAAEPVWVILLDLRIALAEGATCTTILCNPMLAVIPIVITSGRQDIAAQTARLGVGAYLPKPFAYDTIDAIVRCNAPTCAARERGGHHDNPGRGSG